MQAKTGCIKMHGIVHYPLAIFLLASTPSTFEHPNIFLLPDFYHPSSNKKLQCLKPLFSLCSSPRSLQVRTSAIFIPLLRMSGGVRCILLFQAFNAFNSLTLSCEFRKFDVLGLQKFPSNSRWEFHCSVRSIYCFPALRDCS